MHAYDMILSDLQVIAYKNVVSEIIQKLHTNCLLTGSAVITGKYQTGVLAVRIEHAGL